MSDVLNEIGVLLKKEWLIEKRKGFAISSALLYVFATVFVSFLSFKQVVSVPVWNALLWIIILFCAINTVAKSFISETSGNMIYFHTLVSANAMILSKTIYNAAFTIFVSLFAFLCYALFIGNVVQDMLYFILVLIIGSTAISSLLTLVSAIASQGYKNISLMSVLSLPLIIPTLMLVIKASKKAVDGLDRSLMNNDFLLLIALNFLIVALAYILYPFLWRE
jgi:heme exporter protein B